jgi:hypothetical protein
MKRIAIITAMLATLVPASAVALDYNCSPLTGGCTPRSSQPSYIDPPTVYVPQRRVAEVAQHSVQLRTCYTPSNRR